jgi:hypothetical protein
MTNNDLRCISKFNDEVTIISKNLNACILSPTIEYDYYNSIFDQLSVLSRDDWDLNKKSDYKFDIIVANNILHYSKSPQLWIDNLMNSCDLLLVQDLMKRKRSNKSEYGNDGDSMRYSFDNYQYFDKPFNLSNLKYKITNSYIYDGDVNEYDKSPKHFISLITHDT